MVYKYNNDHIEPTAFPKQETCSDFEKGLIAGQDIKNAYWGNQTQTMIKEMTALYDYYDALSPHSEESKAIAKGIQYALAIAKQYCDNKKTDNGMASAHWIYNGSLFDAWTCSNCKGESDKHTDYCPHCGLPMNERDNDMDGGKTDEVN